MAKLTAGGDRSFSSVKLTVVYFLLAAAIAVVDQLTKWWTVSQKESLLESPLILAPFLRLVYVENSGAAFGFFADAGVGGRIALSLLAAVIGLCLAAMIIRRPPPATAVACALLLGGAMGNVINRIGQGYVVDFIDAHWKTYHWPAFNAADMAICGGAAILLWTLFFTDSNISDPAKNTAVADSDNPK